MVLAKTGHTGSLPRKKGKIFGSFPHKMQDRQNHLAEQAPAKKEGSSDSVQGNGLPAERRGGGAPLTDWVVPSINKKKIQPDDQRKKKEERWVRAFRTPSSLGKKGKRSRALQQKRAVVPGDAFRKRKKKKTGSGSGLDKRKANRWCCRRRFGAEKGRRKKKRRPAVIYRGGKGPGRTRRAQKVEI